MTALRAGELNRLLSVQSRSATIDAVGGQSTTWSTVKQIWASIDPMSGRELLAAQARTPEVTHLITVRYDSTFANPTVAATYRLQYGTRNFNILASLNELERNHRIAFHCSEGPSDG